MTRHPRTSRGQGRLTAAVAAVFLAGLLLFPTALSAAQETPPWRPFLWQVEGPSTSFIFGTVHLPDERVLRLPAAVEEAFAASDAVFTEITLDLATQAKVSAYLLLEDDATLDTLLPGPLYRRAAAYVESKGRKMELFNRFRIWNFMVNLTLLDDFRAYLSNVPMDAALYTRAEALGKETGGLETVEEQIGVFESLSVEEQAGLLRQTLDHLEDLASRGEKPSEELIEIYLSGDETRLTGEVAASMDLGDPVTQKFLRLLLTDRNRRMADRILAELSNRPGTAFFFAVGALHCTGDDGLPALLRREGLAVTRIPAAGSVTAAAGP